MLRVANRGIMFKVYRGMGGVFRSEKKGYFSRGF